METVDHTVITNHIKFISHKENIIRTLYQDNKLTLNRINTTPFEIFLKYIFLENKKKDIEIIKKGVQELESENKVIFQNKYKDKEKVKEELDWVKKDSAESFKERDELIKVQQSDLNNSCILSSSLSTCSSSNDKNFQMKRLKKLKNSLSKFETDIFFKKIDWNEKFSQIKLLKEENSNLRQHYKQKKIIYQQLQKDNNLLKEQLNKNGKKSPRKKINGNIEYCNTTRNNNHSSFLKNFFHK